jgi:hypothetical protein
MKKTILKFCLLSIIFVLPSYLVQAQQTTAFSYQGKLNSSSTPANGSYDLRFELYDALSGGNLIGTMNSNGVQLTNGIFTVQLDFGASAFNGSDRYLDISVKLPAEPAYARLTPRQKLQSVPYATKAINSDSATNAQTADFAINAQTANNATNLGGVAANSYLRANGDGSQLVNVGGTIRWNVITGNQQAQSNNGYFANLFNSPTETLINLPVNPQVGDMVRVSGNSDWKITQNIGQVVTRNENEGLVNSVSWKSHLVEGGQTGNSIASSADGSKLVASFGVFGSTVGKIFTSTDYGLTWTLRNNALNLTYLASSADGTKLVGLAYLSRIYTSSDSGITWIPRDTNRQWFSVASSADGTKLIGVVIGGQIYTSTDSGVTWTPRESNRNWFGVASSADGTKLAAIVSGGLIYTSADSGENWTPSETPRSWVGIESSADGTKLFAVAESAPTNGIFISSDSGVNWTFRTFPGSMGFAYGFRQFAMSSSGKDITVTTLNAVNSNRAFSSSDYGQTWLGSMNSSANGYSITSSADGRRLFLVGRDGFVYTNQHQLSSSKSGTLGSITGGGGSYVELLYIGNGEFTIVNSKGVIRFF